MNKTEIIKLALIILGITIIVRSFENLVGQIPLFLQLSSENDSMYIWILTLVALLIVLTLIGYFIIKKSDTISKKIIRNDEGSRTEIALNKLDLIHISTIILCLYFIVTLSPSFITSISTIIIDFFTDFNDFREILPQQIWTIILYITIFVLLANSKKFAIWIEKKTDN